MKPTAFGPVRWAMNVPPMLRADGRPDETAHHVLLVLATFAKKDGTDARPGLETLADKAYLTTTKAAADALERIAAAGLISKTGEFGGTVVWTLHMHITRSGPTAIDERRERAREKHRERQRRYAERKKADADGVPQRQLTVSDSVSNEGVLTQPDSVSEPRLTVCDTVTDAVPHRQLTLSPPSEPQVSTAVTAIELPLNCQLLTTSAPTAQERDDAFEEFWSTYPRKIAKGAARKAWTKAIKDGHDPTVITAGAARFADQRRGQDTKYTPHPATWLNAERWGDEPEQPALRAVSNGYQPWRNPTNQDDYDEDLY